MRPADTTAHPTTSTTWSESDLVELTIRLANQPTGHPGPTGLAGPTRPSTEPTPANAGPLAGRVTHPGGGVLRPSTAPTHPGGGVPRPSTAPGHLGGVVLRPSTAPAHREAAAHRPPTSADAAWSVPLLITPDVEAWLLGWPAGVVTPAHDHGGATVAVTVVEGSLSEECLDPTIWTTGRRTTWRAGASTLFPSGHVHLLGAAGDRPAVAVHAWSGLAGSADRVAGRLALARGGAVA
jgi:quercetin dioxygenase-like cupin family protein